VVAILRPGGSFFANLPPPCGVKKRASRGHCNFLHFCTSAIIQCRRPPWKIGPWKIGRPGPLQTRLPGCVCPPARDRVGRRVGWWGWRAGFSNAPAPLPPVLGCPRAAGGGLAEHAGRARPCGAAPGSRHPCVPPREKRAISI